MNWWNDLIDWTASDRGWRVISGAVIPFVAIVVAGIVAALIGRAATKRVVALQEREAKNAAVAGVISAARKAATWGSLGHDERAYADHLAEDADIRLRLLPIAGAPIAANWAQHEITDIKKNSSTFSFQAEQSLTDFRDRMLEWQARPGRARKLFKSDLERWKFESPDPDADLISRQQQWNADQAEPRRGEAAPTPTTTSLRPAPQPGGPASPASRVASPTTAMTAPADATRPFGDSTRGTESAAPATRPASPIRPQLGSPAARPQPTTPASPAPTPVPGRAAGGPVGRDVVDAEVVDDDGPERSGQDDGGTARIERPVPPQQARDADASDDTTDAGELTAPKVDAASTTNTTSIPTRITDEHVEPADADETSESPYAHPVSASELRRRGDDDEE